MLPAPVIAPAAVPTPGTTVPMTAPTPAYFNSVARQLEFGQTAGS